MKLLRMFAYTVSLEKSFHKPQAYIVLLLVFIACDLIQTLAYPF